MKHHDKVMYVLLGVALVFAAGCWNDAEQIAAAVWSDDDTGQAYLKLYYEESTTTNPFTGGPNKRNFQHQIFVQNSNGTNRRAINEIRDGSLGTHFYYMHKEGYVLLDVVEDGGTVRFDVVRTVDGAARMLARWSRSPEPDVPASPCVSFEALPSPDGSVIATVERTAAANTPAGCEDGRLIVSFVDAGTLSTISTFEWSVEAMVDAGWRRNGDFLVWNYRGSAWQVDPSTGPAPATAPSCTFPRTSSSSISDDGVMIAPGDSDDAPIVVVSRDGTNCW